MQRRHQKLVEESPSPGLIAGDPRRPSAKRPCGWSRRPATPTPARSSSSSTSSGNFYFIEVNARIQVEHPVTETGHRHRPDQGADPHRRRRAAAVQAGRHRAARRTPSSAASTPRTPARTSAPRRARSTNCASPAGSGVRFDSHVYAGLRHLAVLRLDDRQADRPPRRAERPSPPCSGPWANSTSPPSRTTIPLHLQIMDNQHFLPARWTPALSNAFCSPNRPSSLNTLTGAFSGGRRPPLRVRR